MATSASTVNRDSAGPLSPLPAEAQPFSTERTVRTGDVDTDRRLRLDGVARFLQDIGTDNLEAVDASDTDPLWIVRRTVIDVHRPAEWPTTLRLRRWCDALSSRWANIRVRFDDPAGDPATGPLIETAAFWIDISPTTGAPKRISDALFEHMARHALDTRLKWQAWLPVDVPDEANDAGAFPLRVTDLDPFGHVNNAVYWHAVEEVLASHPELQESPHRALIEHLRPVMKGEPLELRTQRHDDELTVWFTVAGHTRAVARINRI